MYGRSKKEETRKRMDALRKKIHPGLHKSVYEYDCNLYDERDGFQPPRKTVKPSEIVERLLNRTMDSRHHNHQDKSEATDEVTVPLDPPAHPRKVKELMA